MKTKIRHQRRCRRGAASDSARADGNFGGQGCEQSTDLCLSDCGYLLLVLVLLILALLVSMGLNLLFCIRQGGALLPGTALKRWISFKKMQTASVNPLYFIHTDKCCHGDGEKYAF